MSRTWPTQEMQLAASTVRLCAQCLCCLCSTFPMWHVIEEQTIGEIGEKEKKKNNMVKNVISLAAVRKYVKLK